MQRLVSEFRMNLCKKMSLQNMTMQRITALKRIPSKQRVVSIILHLWEKKLRFPSALGGEIWAPQQGSPANQHNHKDFNCKAESDQNLWPAGLWQLGTIEILVMKRTLVISSWYGKMSHDLAGFSQHQQTLSVYSITHNINVWCIYLHVPYKPTKCRYI